MSRNADNPYVQDLRRRPRDNEDIEQLRKMGMVGADGAYLPFDEWPKRTQEIWKALRDLEFKLGRAAVAANPGILKQQ